MPTPKGQQRRKELIEAAGHLLATSGPSGVTMRAVAKEVGCSLSATVYSFADRDELLAEAGRHNIALWAGRAERVAEKAEAGGSITTGEELVELLLEAVLSRETLLYGHYVTLLAAGSSAPVARACFTGRGRLNSAVGRVLRVAGARMSAELVITIVDGAAVTALSEGRDVHDTARGMLREALAPESGDLSPAGCAGNGRSGER